MKAVGRHHSTGRNSRTRIPRPYPAPEIIASVPYVPPETMKNVAATSGQSVNFAALFFEMGSAWEGIWAGRDKVLNFFSRPPKVTLAFQFLEASSPFEEYNLCPRMQEKNGVQRNFFEQANGTSVLDASFQMRRIRVPPRCTSQ